MNRTISRLTALSAAALLMLPSCLGKGKNTPDVPSIKPLSTLTGKVEKRVITRLSAAGTEEERTEEVYRRTGGLLTKVVYGIPASGGSLQPIETTTNTYDEQGYRVSEVVEKLTATGTKERTETKYTYRPFSPQASYVSSYKEYDSQGRLVADVTHELEGSRLSRVVRTVYDYSAGGANPKETVLRTNYTYMEPIIESRTFTLVTDPKAVGGTGALYHEQARMRVDYYGRKLFEEIHTFDTSVGVAKQDLKKPNGATVATYTYGDTGDIVRELRETHGPRTQAEYDADKEHKLPLLKLIDRYYYEVKYTQTNTEGFPTKMEVTVEKGVAKTKTTYTANISYTYFADPAPKN